MSDLPRNGGGWRVLPQDYLARRPAAYGVVAPAGSRTWRCATACGWRSTSTCRRIPRRRSALPAIVIFTPYYRRFALRSDAPPSSEPSVSAGRYRDFFVPRGYALVVVDVRGTGASFGVREGFRSPKERDDYREIVDWIVAQRWSNGAVGATGVSYVGAAADFLASTGHPAVKAIAPLFSVWERTAITTIPAACCSTGSAETYDELMIALDHGRGELLGKFAYYKDPHLRPAPVDEDRDGTLLKAALTRAPRQLPHAGLHPRVRVQGGGSALRYWLLLGVVQSLRVLPGRAPGRRGVLGVGLDGRCRLFERRDRPLPQPAQSEAAPAARPVGPRRART